ncbi:MAG: ligase-associated DNA damage response endonuclease PdeM [Aquabacterium sp.]
MTTPPGDHVLEWAGRHRQLTLHLTPERAAYWPAERTLFVADMHLGKAAVFRARGLPVPQGTTTATLARLSAVIERVEARCLVVLGDFLHAKESHAPATMRALQAWRSRHADVACHVVRGNHDRHAGDVASALGFTPMREPYIRSALIGVHEAHEAWPHLMHGDPLDTLVLTGHTHPVAELRGRVDRLRLPCYHLTQNLKQNLTQNLSQGTAHVLTLPAFGAFTGGHPVDLGEPGSSVFVIGDGSVQPLHLKHAAPP